MDAHLMSLFIANCTDLAAFLRAFLRAARPPFDGVAGVVAIADGAGDSFDSGDDDDVEAFLGAVAATLLVRVLDGVAAG